MTDHGGETLSGNHYRRFLQAVVGSEPMPNPKEAAHERLREDGFPDLEARRILKVLDDGSLTVCHKAPNDD